MHSLLLTFAAICLFLSACADLPPLDPGFVLRSDLKTTDCDGIPVSLDIDATYTRDVPFHFMTQREPPTQPLPGRPDKRARVDDCRKPGEKVLVSAGFKPQLGDVIYVGTGSVGPTFNINKTVWNPMHSPAALSAPVRITLRHVNSMAGRLYAEEDAFLAAAFSMAARAPNQSPSSDLADALEHHQLVLWNTLIDNLRLWRDSGSRPSGPRLNLTLLVDHAQWCLDFIKKADAAISDKDRKNLTRYFSGNENQCPSDPSLNNEFSTVNAPARSALHAVGLTPTPVAGYFPSPNYLALYTQVTADIKGAHIGARDAASSTGAWTLADWQYAQICHDAKGNDLSISAFQMTDGQWVYVQSEEDEIPTIAVQWVVTQTMQARQLIKKGKWWQRWKLVIGAADLDKIYGREITNIRWSGKPTVPSMCLVSEQ